MICNFIWLITATPYVLLEKNKYPNILGLNPSFSMFSAIVVKNDDEFVKRSFKMPPNTVIRYKCRNIIYDILKNSGNVQKNIEELASADNISGLLEYLGASRESCASVIDLILKRKLGKLDEIGKMLSIKDSEKLSLRYKNLYDDIENLTTSFKKSLQENNCSICLDNYKEPSLVTCCQNIFCGKCITTVLISTTPGKCPLCRKEIGVRNVICIGNYSPPNSNINRIQIYKTKSQTVIDIILSKMGKYIIYSDYIETFDTLKRYLGENNINYTEMKGAKSQREKSLENYRVGDVNVLFLTTLQYSAGIDLINTTDIILYHDMSESTKTQIIGRANRIGRTIPLNIHCMF
jgi:SNF2 family DNA or RNA helicase